MSDLPNFVPGLGSSTAKLMVVGMAPGPDEDEERKVWVGRAGRLMREMLTAAREKPDNCYLTNVEKYRPPGDKLNRFKEIGRKPLQDIELLWTEVDAIRPYCILALGEHALKALTGKRGIKHWRGSILTTLRYPEVKVVATYHPSALLRSESSETKAFSYSARVYIQNDYARAVAQSKFRELRRPTRDFVIAECAEDIRNFRKLYRGLNIVSSDIETAKGACIPTCTGFAFNRHHGMSIPLLNVGYGMHTPDTEQVRMIKAVQEIYGEEDLKIIGANWKFDKKKLYKPFAFNVRASTYWDVGMANHILYPEFPKSVEFLTSTWTEEPFYKNELKEFDPEKEDFKTILLYNAKDVCVPFEIYERQKEEMDERNLTDFFLDDIMPLSDFYLELEERGMGFDETIRNDIRDYYKAREAELFSSLTANIGYELDIGSYKAVRKLLFEELEIPPRKNTKDDTLVSILATHCKDDNLKYSIISDLLEIRKVRRTVNGPLKSPPDYDSRMRSMCNINGTAIGRTSFNILKPPERPTKLGLQFQNITKHGEIGPEMRRMLVPDNGKLFYQVDMSQADVRVVAALSRDEWLLSLFERKKDVHSITASWYFDKEREEYPEDPIGIEPGERFIGKTTRHGVAYGEQWKTMQMSINKLARKFGINITVTAAECKIFRAIFLRKSPKIEAVFWKEILETINKKGRRLVAASGRERTFFGLWDPNLYFSYIPAASVTDHNKFAAVRSKRRIPQLEILKEDHDSILFQAYPKDAEEFIPIIREEYERPMDLSKCSLPRDPIVIPCDVEFGENYKDLVKWKR